MAPLRHRDASQALLRSTVVEAIRRLLEERPWSSITMTEIAQAAGVSRQTLYNEFGDRHGLATAYAEWALDLLFQEIARSVLAHADDLEAAIQAGIATFLSTAIEHPLVRAVEATSRVEGVAALVSGEFGAGLVAIATASVEELIRQIAPKAPPHELHAGADAIVRLAFSHLTLPSLPPEEAARQITGVIMPLVREVLARR